MPKKKRRRKRKATRYSVGSVSSVPTKRSRGRSKSTRVVLTAAEVKRGVARRKKQWGK